ncbi:hypothetical protein BH24ACT5_BH24ACT5_25370 [soil metagenome]
MWNDDVNEAKSETVDTAGGVRQDHSTGALVRGEASKGPETPGPAVVPDHPGAVAASDDEPAQADLQPFADARLRLLRQAQSGTEGVVGRLEAGREQADHVVDARAQAVCCRHEVLDRRTQAATTRMSPISRSLRWGGTITAVALIPNGARTRSVSNCS